MMGVEIQSPSSNFTDSEKLVYSSGGQYLIIISVEYLLVILTSPPKNTSGSSELAMWLLKMCKSSISLFGSKDEVSEKHSSEKASKISSSSVMGLFWFLD